MQNGTKTPSKNGNGSTTTPVVPITKKEEPGKTLIVTAPSVAAQIDKFQKLSNLINERNHNIEAVNRLDTLQIVDTPQDNTPQLITIHDDKKGTITIRRPENIRQVIDLLRRNCSTRIATIENEMVEIG